MKLITTILFLCFCFDSFCQTGKAKIDITITDTIKPYFLDIYVLKDQKQVFKTAVMENGNYIIGDFLEGTYRIEILSFESIHQRRLHIDSVNVFKDSITSLQIIYPGDCKFVYIPDFTPLCPYNHADKVVKIVYGFPSKKAMSKSKKGLIHLGGCITTDCDPRYYCPVHKKEL